MPNTNTNNNMEYSRIYNNGPIRSYSPPLPYRPPNLPPLSLSKNSSSSYINSKQNKYSKKLNNQISKESKKRSQKAMKEFMRKLKKMIRRKEIKSITPPSNSLKPEPVYARLGANVLNNPPQSVYHSKKRVTVI